VEGRLFLCIEYISFAASFLQFLLYKYCEYGIIQSSTRGPDLSLYVSDELRRFRFPSRPAIV